MNALTATLRNLGPARLAAIAGVAIIVFGFFIFLMTRFSTHEMALLYSDLDSRDAGQITERLTAQNVPFEIGSGGTSIHVPSDQVDQMRMAMAADGLPRGGSIGYELFDESSGLGTTNFVQNINRLRAMEGELARTIASMTGVSQARVHLVLPERELFSRDRQDPSASVFLRLSGGRPGDQQVAAIQHIVAAGVPGLEPSNISVVDERGTLLARGPGGSLEELRLETTTQIRQTLEQQLTTELEELLSRTLGYGRVRARVSADMDFDRVNTTEERFDPDSQVARSQQFTEESRESSADDGVDPVTIAENLPEADVPGLGAGGTSTDTEQRSDETINYEINRIVQNTVRDTGRVDRLSVAVLVDGTYETGPDGTREYVAREDQELQQLEALVRSAIGYNADRGDSVEVVNMRFVSAEEAMFPDETGTLLGMSRDDWFRVAEIVVLGIVAILVILLVVRPLLMRVLEGTQEAAAGDAFDGFLPDGTMQRTALAGPQSGMGALTPADLRGGDSAEDEEGDDLDAMIDINQVSGRVRASSLKKVGDIVEKHPEEAVSIIRNWLYQET